MKKNFTLILVCFSLFAKADYWTQKANFPGPGRDQQFYFSIGNKGYVGGGWSGNYLITDFWEYDPSLNIWTQKANCADTNSSPIRSQGFSINNKGYTLTEAQFSNQLWEYNPAANLWTQKLTFSGFKRIFTSQFVIGNKGYIGCGYITSNDIYTNDFWEWDQPMNNWTQKTSFPDTAREYGFGFSIYSKGYFFGGGKI